MSVYTERENTGSKLKSIEEIEADFNHILKERGSVRITPRLEACISEIRIRIRTARKITPTDDKLRYERYVRALQKFVSNFIYQIETRVHKSGNQKRAQGKKK